MTETFPRQSARTRRFTLGEPRGFVIADDGRRVLFLRALAGSDPRTGVWVLDPDSGAERLVVDPRVLGDDASLTAEEKARRERVRETAAGVVAFTADDAGRVVVCAAGGQVWAADVDSGDLRSLPVQPGAYDPRIDPTGSAVAYVSGGALRFVAADGSGDRCLLAADGGAVSWGRAEFVAAEEMDRTRGYWWSPDGATLLVARVDESPVQQWWIADPAHPDRPPTAVRYPRAGTPDADVSLHLVGLDGRRTEVRWDRERFPYLARVQWSRDRPPLLQVQTRDQRTVQTLTVEVAHGTTTVRHEDCDPVWVELFPGVPAWCGEQIVRIVDDATARRLVVGDDAVTGEGCYVRSVVAADAAGVVFTASMGDPSEVHVLHWTAAGVEQLTDQPGVHGAVHRDGVTVVTSASLAHDGQRHVVRRAGRSTPVDSHAETPVLTPEVRVLRLGPRQVSAGLVLPRGHRPGTKLPVLVDSYGGPHAQRVLATRRIWLEPQWWADQGFAVLVVDGRGTPGRDPAWERAVHLDFATPVLEDQVDALRAAAEIEPDLDLTRVGIRGWSFGGYLSALAVLRRPDVFHAAVAGAPVTDWTLYDTHYTERYLGTPQDQPDSYARTVLLDDAPTLSRPLLLVHGLADDNVVAAHTLLLSQRLTESGRAHRVLPLTGVTHMTPQETVAENLLLLQRDFLLEALAERSTG